MINDTSEHIVAVWLWCNGTFDQCFMSNLLLSLFWKSF